MLRPDPVVCLEASLGAALTDSYWRHASVCERPQNTRPVKGAGLLAVQGRIVLVGDQKQLGPLVLSAAGPCLRRTLFERFQNDGVQPTTCAPWVHCSVALTVTTATSPTGY